MEAPFLISEIAQAHNGSLDKAHSYIEALAKTGVDAIKFQTHIANAESSIYEPFRIQFSKQDKNRFEYWKRMEFSLEEWKGLKSHCDEVGVEFMSSPFSNAAVEMLEEVGIKRYKVGSGEVTNHLLLERIAQTGKPVILSSGMSSYEELDAAVEIFRAKATPFAVMQCTTAYPTLPDQYGLNIIEELKQRYNVPIGFSDHSAQIATCIAAAALGAELFEFHAVFSRSDFGPDSSSSLEIKEIEQLVVAIQNIFKSVRVPIDKNNLKPFTELKSIFEKSLAVNKNLSKGHVLTFEDLEAKKPAHKGILASEYKHSIGRVLRSDKKQWDFLSEEDLE